MATQGKNNDFPDKDALRKYLQGELSPEEAHRIEKLILNDPFYQEALDGMETLEGEELEYDLKDLSQKIRRRTLSSKKGRSFNFYRIAAAILLLAAFSYVIVYTTSRIEDVSKSESLSQKQDVMEEDNQEPAEIQEKEREVIDKSSDREGLETKPTDREVAANDYAVIEPDLDEPVSEHLTKSTEENISNEKETMEETVSFREFTEPEPLEPEEEALDLAIPAEQKVDYVLTNEEDPYDLTEEQEQDITIQEEFAEVGIADEDENLNFQSNQVRISTEEQESDQGRSDTEPSPELNDIDQTSERNRKESKLARRSEPAPVSVTKAAGAPTSLNEAAIEEILKPVPVNGYEDYSEYIKDNLIHPEKEGIDGIEGKVKLRFIINKDSIPDKIQILQSLEPDYDNEAIRLLLEGPKWIPVYNNGELNEIEVEYSISFELND